MNAIQIRLFISECGEKYCAVCVNPHKKNCNIESSEAIKEILAHLFTLNNYEIEKSYLTCFKRANE